MTTNKQPCIYKIILQNKNARVADDVSHGGISMVGKGRRRGGGDKANTGIGDGRRWRRRGMAAGAGRQGHGCGRGSRLGRWFREGRRELRRGGREHRRRGVLGANTDACAKLKKETAQAATLP